MGIFRKKVKKNTLPTMESRFTICYSWGFSNIESGDIAPKKSITGIENRIYIRLEFRESLGMNFFSPFQPEREFKV